MYHSTAVPRSPEDKPTSPQQYSPRASYAARHDTASSTYHNQRTQPTSPSASNVPAQNGYPHSRTKSASTFYDPIAENGDRPQTWGRATYSTRSPTMTSRVSDVSPRHEPWRDPQHASPSHNSTQYLDQSRQLFAYAESRPEYPPTEKSYTSPSAALPPQHSSSYAGVPYSRSTQASSLPSHSPPAPRPAQEYAPAPAVTTNASSGRSADPMSFSNILSTSDPEPLAKKNSTVLHVSPPRPSEPLMSSSFSTEPVRTKMEAPLQVAKLSSKKHDKLSSRAMKHDHGYALSSPRAPPLKSSHSKRTMTMEKNKVARDLDIISRPTKILKYLVPEKDVEAAMKEIDAIDFSVTDPSIFQPQFLAYQARSQKRSRELDILEMEKRKRRRISGLSKMVELLSRNAETSQQRFRDTYESSMLYEVQQSEVAEEKERKKDMQRKRRREKTLLSETKKRNEALAKAEQATDRAEKEKFLKDMLRAEKKATQTNRLLNGETPSKDLSDISAFGPNLDGGIMSSFQAQDELQTEHPKKKPRIGGRLKKSKEQKQAEIDAAAAAHAAMERDELINIAPKAEAQLESSKREQSITKESISADHGSAYTTKAYNQLYETIWKDIAKKDVPKLYRIKEASTTTKLSNLRKTAILASKEARKWQTKTNKSTKDNQARAKRVMREMLSFWKRNEREERDQRKMAEKQELENAKKAEADREANRQKRKLNFLISQTELYSHFIGKKVKTDEVERSTDDVVATGDTIRPGLPSAHAIDLPDSLADVGTKVTNFEDLDFDAEDETALRRAAMANAQNAVQEAQDRARAFNSEGQMQSQFDDGEMNFQNPTSLQTMDVAQPKMLTCQLKEYQLKGLNWLVNLYEQGINGILADEMGLGKTVQSISVMAYLAEVHNIWGPFLVIAPASTLHNWQQEITRFVPSLTVLPYWGNAKDRKVLRKFWDRKHITYTKDSPFHVLVTSYQLVVADSQYFQKIRWQYMVLDEAQAIKSSQSSRWKSLLGFHCRNRLLLTGTPIQNNMQELWALLHFIMPSLFDSHDEFSDWFSKDIESHAQSNTKLNEDQLKRLHMILKPFMLRRIKKHVQKELGDKIEEDVFCDLTYRQRAYYANLRNKISIMDLIEKASIGDDQDAATLMNLVMQFRKVCNHPDLFERAETTSPVAFTRYAETASFMREGPFIEVAYSVQSLIEYQIPRLIGSGSGRLTLAGADNSTAGWRNRELYHGLSIWTPNNIRQKSGGSDAFSWLRFTDQSTSEISTTAHKDVYARALDMMMSSTRTGDHGTSDEDAPYQRVLSMLNIVKDNVPEPKTVRASKGRLYELQNISRSSFYETGLNAIEPCSRPAAAAPPIDMYCSSQRNMFEKQQTFFNNSMRIVFNNISERTDLAILDAKVDSRQYSSRTLLPRPISEKARYTRIQVPSMRRFVTDSGKLAKLDQLLGQLKEGGHRVLLYFQMTRMIDLMEEYLTYRNYKYCRLDGSTKLEDRRDTVADFQSNPEIFIFLLSTRAGGLGINLTAADTVIFYDSDWNPTIDSQAMDRAHRLGQTRQVTVYRLITRSTIEERIRKRALQKEEVQRVVISGGAGAHVDFNTRSRENRTKDIAMWLADDDQAAEIEKKEAEIAEREAKEPTKPKKKGYVRKRPDVTLDDMYHEGEGHFDDNSNKPSGAVTPVEVPTKGRRKGLSKKAKSVKEKLAIIDGGI